MGAEMSFFVVSVLYLDGGLVRYVLSVSGQSKLELQLRCEKGLKGEESCFIFLRGVLEDVQCQCC